MAKGINWNRNIGLSTSNILYNYRKNDTPDDKKIGRRLKYRYILGAIFPLLD